MKTKIQSLVIIPGGFRLFPFWSRLLFPGLILVVLSFQSVSVNEQRPWQHPRQLTVDDFKMEQPGRVVKIKTGKRSYTELEGFIQTGIAFRYEARNGRTTGFEVFAYMVPDESWLASKNNLLTLAHEQAHFNITEIYARRLRKKLAVGMSTERAKRIYQLTMKELAGIQASFDRDQKGEAGVTLKWKERISDELQELAAFARPQF